MWLYVFLINWIVNILLVEFLAIRKLRSIIEVDEKRDSKYEAFRRYDSVWFTRPYLYMTCHLTIWRFLYAFFTIFVCAAICMIAVLGLPKDQPATGIRYFMIRAAIFWSGSSTLFCGSSLVWVNKQRPNVSYSKYLGEDWECDYDKSHCSTVVINHSSFLDSVINCLYQMPSHITKAEVLKIPGLAQICIAC